MKISVRSLYILCKFTNECSCPRNFWPQVADANLKSDWLVVLGNRISSSFAELKGHEHVAKAVTVGTNLLLYLFVAHLAQYNDENLKSDFLT